MPVGFGGPRDSGKYLTKYRFSCDESQETKPESASAPGWGGSIGKQEIREEGKSDLRGEKSEGRRGVETMRRALKRGIPGSW
jgi:hypothetical protein